MNQCIDCPISMVCVQSEINADCPIETDETE